MRGYSSRSIKMSLKLQSTFHVLMGLSSESEMQENAEVLLFLTKTLSIAHK